MRKRKKYFRSLQSIVSTGPGKNLVPRDEHEHRKLGNKTFQKLKSVIYAANPGLLFKYRKDANRIYLRNPHFQGDWRFHEALLKAINARLEYFTRTHE